MRTGVLLLDGPGLEIPGAMRHPASLPGAPVYCTVPGADPAIVVGPRFAEVADAYSDSAERLRSDGVDLLTSNCGFSIAYQRRLAAESRIPVALSSLVLVPLLAHVYGQRFGVLTYIAAELDGARKVAARWPDDLEIPVVDVQGSEVWRTFRTVPAAQLDVAGMREDVIAVAADLVSVHSLDALLLECTAMFPFARDIRDAVGLPVFDLVGLLRFLSDAIGSPVEV